MDHVKVLKRAWEITWRYRALWLFGVLLALTTGQAGGGGSGGGNGAQYQFNGEDFGWGENFRPPEIPPEVVTLLIAAGIGLVCLVLALSVLGAIARYVSETALIRMVDIHETSGNKPGIKEGFRLGWSRAALRIFLINLLIGLPTALAFLLLFALSSAPLLVWLTQSTALRVIGTVAAIGLFFLVILLVIVVSAALTLLKKFFWRASALEAQGVIEGIKDGFALVRQNLKDVFLMWLIMIGVQIGWLIALIATTIVLLPVVLVWVIIVALIAGTPALVIGGALSLAFGGPVPWILAALIGLPIFALLVGAPWLFANGVMEVFKSSTWTLTYRELRALTQSALMEGEPAPEPASA